MKPQFLCPKCGSCDWQFQVVQIGFLRPVGVSVASEMKVRKDQGLTCRNCNHVEHNERAWREIEEAF